MTFHTKCSPVFSRKVHSVLAVPDCSNQVFAFSFWNGPCGCSRQVFTCALKGSVWPSRASVGSRYSPHHLDKGASQSLIIYLMCDAIFPDFWVICATAGCTSRVGGKWERAEGAGGGERGERGEGEAQSLAFRIVHRFPLMLNIMLSISKHLNQPTNRFFHNYWLVSGHLWQNLNLSFSIRREALPMLMCAKKKSLQPYWELNRLMGLTGSRLGPQHRERRWSDIGD